MKAQRGFVMLLTLVFVGVFALMMSVQWTMLLKAHQTQHVFQTRETQRMEMETLAYQHLHSLKTFHPSNGVIGQYRYHLEKIADMPCLQSQKKGQTYSTQHWLMIVYPKGNAEGGIEVRYALLIPVVACLEADIVYRDPGVLSVRERV